jgi:hypothetical protein
LASAKVRDDPCGQPNLDLGLTGAFERGLLDSIETVAALQAFRKRHADAQRIHGQLSSQPTTVDFTYYRSILKNQNIVNEAEKLLKDFKPVTYDANAHVKAIEAFEEKAVSLTPSHFMTLDFVDVPLQSHLYRLRRHRKPLSKSIWNSKSCRRLSPISRMLGPSKTSRCA